MAADHGFLAIDKPAGITSRAALDRAARWFPRRTKIGHAGTLDPLATGVLVLCVGMATRLTEYVQRMAKIYRASIILGAISDTDDADGAITSMPAVAMPERETIERELAGFIGTIEQVPPAYSAAKVTGRRAYDLARRGEAVWLQPRPVVIHRIDVLAYAYPRLEILVRCGKGTYIRSLARDLGQRLGCGGYIASLRRLAIGEFTEADCLSLDADAATARAKLAAPARVLAFMPSITLGPADVQRLLQGQRVPSAMECGEETMVLDGQARLIAIARVVDRRLIPSKILASA